MQATVVQDSLIGMTRIHADKTAVGIKKRCLTCGRTGSCACGPGCAYCVGGKPRSKAEKENKTMFERLLAEVEGD